MPIDATTWETLERVKARGIPQPPAPPRPLASAGPNPIAGYRRIAYNRAVVISTLTRRTAIADADEWAKRAERFLERARPFLEQRPGFDGIELAREDGGLVETTRWQSMDDCRRYVRDGAAATVATMADAALPTAPYPNGAWMRENSEA